MKLVSCTVFVCFSHSTGLSNDGFSSFRNLNKEARLLRDDMLSIRLRCRNCPDLHPALGTKLRVAKVKHDHLHIALPVNQSILSHITV